MKPQHLCITLILVTVWLLNSAWLPGSQTASHSVVPADSHGRTQIIEPNQVPSGLSAGDWNEIQDLMRQAEYHYTWHDPSAAYVAPNRAQAWHTALGAEGLRVQPSFVQAEADWSWRLWLAAWGYADQLQPATSQPVQHVKAGRVTYQWHDALTEWYINDERGLEHGMTLQRRPARSSGDMPLYLEMAVETDLRPRLTQDRQAVLFADSSGQVVLRYADLVVTDANGKVTPAHLELAHATSMHRTLHPERMTLRMVIYDADAVYPLAIDPLLTSPVARLTATDGAAEDYFGQSVSVNQDTLVVGAPDADIGGRPNQGAAYVFTRNKNGRDAWGQVKKLTASDGAANDRFGGSVSVSEDTVIIGAFQASVGGSGDQGAAYVFYRNQGGADNWGQVKKLLVLAGGAVESFGASVSISGDTLVIGAYQSGVSNHNSQGAAYVFERNQGGADNWGELKELVSSDGQEFDYFGYAVSISGDTIVVGAVQADVGGIAYRGAAYVFYRNQGGANNWGEFAKLFASDGAESDEFGSSVAISGDTIVVGAPGDDIGSNNDQGATYVFMRNQGGADNWGQVKKLTTSGGAASDEFGRSVSICGDTVIVGSPEVDVGSNTDQGMAYVYMRNQGGTDAWGQVNRLTVADGGDYDRFGRSVSVSGDTLVVGASDASIGSNASQGAAYLFVRSGNHWVQWAKPIASDGAATDQFGNAVSLSGDTLVVGAAYAAVGGSDAQGAAYIFTRNKNGSDAWGQVKKVIGSNSLAGDRFGDSVSISGDTVVVGASAANVGLSLDQGAAYVFYRNQGGADNWGQVKVITTSFGAAGDSFGISVSVSGDAVVIGAPGDNIGLNSDQGSAHVFERNQGGADNWGLVKMITDTVGAADDRFGSAVSISGDTVIVGAPGDDLGSNSNQGSAYVFERNQGGADAWGQVKKLTASDGAQADNFGVSVSLSGDTAVVGAWYADIGDNNEQGTAYVFERNQGGADNWGQVKKLLASDGAADDYFGTSVSVDGNTIAIGAYRADAGGVNNQGAAYIYTESAHYVYLPIVLR